MNLKEKILTENPTIEFDKNRDERILNILSALIHYFSKKNEILKFIYKTVKLTDEEKNKINELKQNFENLKKLSDESIAEKVKFYSNLY